jgi:hypothetical protein
LPIENLTDVQKIENGGNYGRSILAFDGRIPEFVAPGVSGSKKRERLEVRQLGRIDLIGPRRPSASIERRDFSFDLSRKPPLSEFIPEWGF